MTPYEESFGRNVANILVQATRVIRGPIPREVRRELSTAVKAGVLGHLKRDGLKPEIFFHPDHKHGAIERQKAEAMYSAKCIAAVVVGDEEKFRIRCEDRLSAKATTEESSAVQTGRVPGQSSTPPGDPQ